MGEHKAGSLGVRGSNPLSSTNLKDSSIRGRRNQQNVACPFALSTRISRRKARTTALRSSGSPVASTSGSRRQRGGQGSRRRLLQGLARRPGVPTRHLRPRGIAKLNILDTKKHADNLTDAKVLGTVLSGLLWAPFLQYHDTFTVIGALEIWRPGAGSSQALRGPWRGDTEHHHRRRTARWPGARSPACGSK